MSEDAEYLEELDEDTYLARARAWNDRKAELFARWLGKAHTDVMHSIIAYPAGGMLDLCYYPHGLPGTAIATMELSELPGMGPSNDAFGCYELVMFTRQRLALDDALDQTTPFGQVHARLGATLNVIARYSAEATLNALDTCEFPADMARIGGNCLIFDAFAQHSDSTGHVFGLLLVTEIFRSEMDYARRGGGAALINRLKRAGHYPYSDLDRKPVT